MRLKLFRRVLIVILASIVAGIFIYRFAIPINAPGAAYDTETSDPPAIWTTFVT